MDDTGVASVWLGLQEQTTGAVGPLLGDAQLIAGTARVGLWQVTTVIPGTHTPGPST
jgi:hypothetical protein